MATIAYDKNNIFAKIIRKEIPAKIVFEDELVMAFHDAFPKRTIHVLVIPKGEYTCFDDFCDKAGDREVTHFFKVISEIVSKLGIKESGYRLIANSKANGGQEVPHFHMHILGGEKVGKMVE